MRLGKKTLIIAFISLLVITFLAGSIYSIYILHSSERVLTLEISKGMGLRQVADRLEESGVVRSGSVFTLYLILRGGEDDIKAGEYEFRPEHSMTRVAEKLINGDVVIRKITIPEGLTIEQIGTLLDLNGVISKEDFVEESKRSDFAGEILGEPLPGLEGYLFPDTYTYTKGIAAEEFIKMMTSRFRKIYKEVKSEGQESHLSDHQVVTLASIIEKETGHPSERGLISAVFHNRLAKGMKLESDPTVIYGLGSRFDGNLTKGHLSDGDSIYNTYRNTGLPPGPITNPGRDSLEAALNPAKVDYLYFVSRGDGTHQFSSSYRDHREAVIKYQKDASATGRKRH